MPRWNLGEKDGTMVKIEINERDVGDLMVMLMDFGRNRGNTFAYILNELKQKYATLYERLSVSEM